MIYELSCKIKTICYNKIILEKIIIIIGGSFDET